MSDCGCNNCGSEPSLTITMPGGGKCPDIVYRRGGCYLTSGFGTWQRYIDDANGLYFYVAAGDVDNIRMPDDGQDTPTFAQLEAAFEPMVGQPVDSVSPDGLTKVLDCADALGGCGQKIAVGTPEALKPDLTLWIDSSEAGLITDDSGDEYTVGAYVEGGANTGLSNDVVPGFNVGLNQALASSSDVVRTMLDKSGNDYHIVVPPANNADLVTYTPNTGTMAKIWERDSYVSIAGVNGRQPLHRLETRLEALDAASVATGVADFDFTMVMRATAAIPGYGSIFASVCRATGDGSASTPGAWQFSRSPGNQTMVFSPGRRADNSAQPPIQTFSAAEIFTPEFHIIRIRHEKGNVKIFLDNILRGEGTIDAIAVWTLTLALNRNSNAGVPMDLQELIFVGRTLNVEEELRLGDYLSCKWVV